MPRIPLNMPKMSMTMEFGTVEEWLIEVGGAVADGDAIVVVTTDKVDMDVESTTDGVLAEIVAQPGEEVPVGQPIAWIESEKDDLLGDLFAGPTEPAESSGAESASAERGAPLPAPESLTGSAGSAVELSDARPRPEEVPPAPLDSPDGRPSSTSREPAVEADSATPVDAVAGPRVGSAADASEPTTTVNERPRAVPLARRLAAEAGIDLSAVEPSGPHATIRARDVRAAIEAGPSGTSDGVSTRLTNDRSSDDDSTDELLGDARQRRLRVATAKVLTASAAIPQFTVWRAFDLTRLAVARTASLKGVSWNTILLRAYALMLREYQGLNGSWAEVGVRPNAHVGISLAIDTPNGLLAPVLRDPQDLGIHALNTAIKELAGTVKAGKVDPASLSGGTGTVSNLGSFGVQKFNALLTPPQATALSLGTVENQPTFDAVGAIRAKTVCEAGLTIDHRVADGADGARALATMQEILDDPFLLLG